ncbi:exopolyphosphatase [Thalassotalea sp. HSM 43]|uniref:exopolyphosphatase n=1 Tax=Thalassotalea sp. HSM 43 TaxID=2552945 RepID=UPI00108007DE|nr:exopolyphosphatase [Thalassotalea sp. HSM 43]QBY05671.1 exopolyphosphatase [Thalassotalea sp. HSM 43]
MADNTGTAHSGNGLEPQTIAVVDLGSNSFHLVLARIVEQDVQILLREKIKVRLAKGLDDDLILNEEAMERGLQTLEIFSHTLNGFHPDHVNILATYTLRTAKNRNEFINRAKLVLPYPIKLVSGQEEARLIYNGVAHSMHFPDKRLVIDIGGGSTEFALGQHFEPLALSSRNVGCVNLTQQFFADGKISEKRFDKAVLKVERELQPIVKRYRQIGWQACIGTSGTASALLEAGRANELCEETLTHKALKKLKKKLLAYEDFESIDLAGISEDRKGVIVSGLAVMLGAFEMLQIDELEYNDKALREGALYEMEDQLEHDDIRERSVDSLISRMSVDLQHSERVHQTSQILCQQINDNWTLKSIPDSKKVLHWAAKLHEIGLHINSSGANKHSAYIVANSGLPGFSQEKQQLLTLLLRFHRKKIKHEEFADFTLFKVKDVYRILAIFRLAVLLNQKRQDDFLPELIVNADKEQLNLTFADNWMDDKSLLYANLLAEQEHLRALDIELRINEPC